jgi:hypothetical protein
MLPHAATNTRVLPTSITNTGLQSHGVAVRAGTDHGKEPAASTKSAEFLYHLSDYQLFKNLAARTLTKIVTNYYHDFKAVHQSPYLCNGNAMCFVGGRNKHQH